MGFSVGAGVGHSGVGAGVGDGVGQPAVGAGVGHAAVGAGVGHVAVGAGVGSGGMQQASSKVPSTSLDALALEYPEGQVSPALKKSLHRDTAVGAGVGQAAVGAGVGSGGIQQSSINVFSTTV